MKLTLAEVRNREGDVKEFVFRSDAPLAWAAGQYLHYRLPHADTDDRGDERWFTNSAAPSEGEVRITTRIDFEQSSSFKRALLALKPGDQIEADAPEGDFTIDDTAKQYIFIAGGIGITPYRSMLVEAAGQGQQLHVELVYAHRTDEVTFKDELERLQADNPNLHVRYVVQPERLDEQMLRSVIEAVDDPTVYVSGPEPMVEAMTAQIAKLGVGEDKIKGDYFPGYPAE